MLVKIEYPPIYDKIDERFGLKKLLPDVTPIFAWGMTIYNPHNCKLHEFLIEHERVHARQQNGDPYSWWREYIADQDFRLQQEIPAHVAEHMWLLRETKDREGRRRLLRITANRLSHQIYGYVPRIPPDRARGLLKAAIRNG